MYMQVTLESKNPFKIKTQALCLLIADDTKMVKGSPDIVKSGIKDVHHEKITTIHTKTSAQRIILASIKGHEKDNDIIRHVSGLVAKKIKELELNEFVFVLPSQLKKQHVIIQNIIEGAIPAMYTFSKYKTRKQNLPTKFKIIAQRNKLNQQAVKHAKIISECVVFTKELCNLPPSECTPAVLADYAKKIAKTNSLKINILGKAQLIKGKFGGIVAVGQGSKNEPRLITLEYNGAGKQRPIVLVGKAVTFDTGGISLKPGEKMEEMKFDKCGGCVVLGIVKAVAELKLGLNIVGIIPSVENMPDGQAYRPGDIVTLFSGKTAEILNTDAEGRLILADALSYGEKKYSPRAIIDFATLTGACIVALGNNVAGLVSNNDSLAEKILDASQVTCEKLWRLPLDDDYMDMVKSDFADIRNMGIGRAAGTITAAAFLKNAINKTPWAHIDIAGTAWTQGATKYRSYNPKGATAYGVRLILKYLSNV